MVSLQLKSNGNKYVGIPMWPIVKDKLLWKSKWPKWLKLHNWLCYQMMILIMLMILHHRW